MNDKNKSPQKLLQELEELKRKRKEAEDKLRVVREKYNDLFQKVPNF